MAKTKPILFTGEMVRAILDGRKTQTRRVIKPQPEYHDGYRYWWKGDWDTRGGPRAGVCTHGSPGNGEATWTRKEIAEHCPFGVVGDRLWVREGWRCTGGGDLRNIIYRVDGDSNLSFCGIDDGRMGILHVPEPHWAEWDRLVYKTNKGCNWRSPIHMYKWAARIWLEITAIRVERVQDINEKDITKEGDPFVPCFPHIPTLKNNRYKWFKELWDSINAKRGYGWETNPYIWAIEFRKVKDGD